MMAFKWVSYNSFFTKVKIILMQLYTNHLHL